MTYLPNTRKEKSIQFLSFQSLKYIGMILLTISQFTVLAEFYGKYMLEAPILSEKAITFFKNFSSMGMPLILIGVLTNILYNKDKIIRLIIIYFVGAVSFIFIEQLAITLSLRYLLYQSNITVDKDVIKILSYFLKAILGSFLNLNIFVDFFLCSLFYFFMFYKVRRHVKLFRSLIIIPLLYMLTSFVLISLSKNYVITLGFYTNSILASKRISNYAIFLGMLIMLKIKSTRNNVFSLDSKYVTMYLCVLIAIISTIDYFLSYIPDSTRYLVGDSYTLFLAIPILIFFNYKAKIKYKWVKFTVPVYYTFSYGILFYYYSNVIIAILSIFTSVTTLYSI